MSRDQLTEYVIITIVCGMDGDQYVLYKLTDDKEFYDFIAVAHKEDHRMERPRWSGRWMRTHEHPGRRLHVDRLIKASEDLTNNRLFSIRHVATGITEVSVDKLDRLMAELLQDML